MRLTLQKVGTTLFDSNKGIHPKTAESHGNGLTSLHKNTKRHHTTIIVCRIQNFTAKEKKPKRMITVVQVTVHLQLLIDKFLHKALLKFSRKHQGVNLTKRHHTTEQQ